MNLFASLKNKQISYRVSAKTGNAMTSVSLANNTREARCITIIFKRDFRRKIDTKAKTTFIQLK